MQKITYQKEMDCPKDGKKNAFLNYKGIYTYEIVLANKVYKKANTNSMKKLQLL